MYLFGSRNNFAIGIRNLTAGDSRITCKKGALFIDFDRIFYIMVLAQNHTHRFWGISRYGRKKMRSILLLTLILFVHIGSTEGNTTETATDANTGRTQTGYMTTGKVLPAAPPLNARGTNNEALFNDVTPINKYLFFYSADSTGQKKSATSNWEEDNYLPAAFMCDIGVAGSIDASGKTIEMTNIFKQYLADYSGTNLNTDGVINFSYSASSSKWRQDICRIEIDIDQDSLVNFSDYADFILSNFDPLPTTAGNPLSLQIIGKNNDITAALSLNLVKGGVVLEDASFGATTPPKQTTATAH